MAYRVLHDGRGIVQVFYRGCVPVSQRAAALARTLVLLERHGDRRVLIDFTGARLADDPISRLNGFVTAVATSARLRECAIAFVGPPSNHFNDAFETLAQARGYDFRRFHARAEANAWLLG